MHAAIAKVNTGTDGVAVHGYDVVAYFLEGRAVRGTSEFEHDWQDAKWQFASAANKDLFAANPERYVPQYGGFCATCLALDSELSDANPKAWTIVDGKLYLNYSMHQRTQWRIRSNVYVKLGDEAWTEVVGLEEKRAASDESYRIAVMKPAFYSASSSNPNPETIGNLGGDIYKTIRQQSSFSIVHADEPVDPSALGYLSRGGDWPFLQTNVKPNEAWEGGVTYKEPNLERIYLAGQDLELDVVVMWFYRPAYQMLQWPVEVYAIDIEKQRVYLHKGKNTEADALVRQALNNFLAGREGYRVAVLNPGFNYSGQPWGAGVSSLEETFLGLGGDIYRAIQEQSSISISFADEPPDPSARSEVNRGGDWPFPETSVDRKVVWEWESSQQYMTPNLEQVYQAGRKLGVDGVVMYYFKPVWRFPQWPVEVYVIDIEQQRVYAHKGTNTETSTLVRQAFSDFVTGRKP
jgi:YHS domain-containing protein